MVILTTRIITIRTKETKVIMYPIMVKMLMK